jgi:hypothetical protein
MDFKAGDVVKVAWSHWLRPGETGRIVAVHEKRLHAYLIEFERRGPGLGIDGDKLYLAPGQFSRVETRAKQPRRARKKSGGEAMSGDTE